MNTKENQRSRITKLLFKNTLIDLMENKPISKITIKEICESAELNRSTFYLHFNEPNDILRCVEDDIIKSTSDYLNKIGTGIDKDAFRYVDSFLHYIKENDKYFRTLLINNDNPYFKKKFISTSLEKIIHSLKVSADEDLKSYVYGFTVNGCLNIIIQWIESGYSLNECEVASLLFHLSEGALKYYVK